MAVAKKKGRQQKKRSNRVVRLKQRRAERDSEVVKEDGISTAWKDITGEE